MNGNSTKEPLIGAHVSIAGGVDRAPLRGGELGCTAIQIFLKYNTRWQGKPIAPEERSAFFRNRKRAGIRSCVAHGCYLINLASPDEIIYRKSLNAMMDELERAAFLRVPFLVIHPGSHMGDGEERGIHRIADSLNLLLEKTRGSRVKILLETTAGQGTGIGHRFEQIAGILQLVKNRRRLGVCLDTAHIFAAGYDIRTGRAYRKTMHMFDDIIGIARLRVIHMNDSRKPMGSRVDRHEHIGKGFIGLEAFRLIMNDRRFEGIPKILETPKEPEPAMDGENLRILRELALEKGSRGRRGL